MPSAAMLGLDTILKYDRVRRRSRRNADPSGRMPGGCLKGRRGHWSRAVQCGRTY